ncbi:MAG: hypothetical protein ABEJ86_02330 [Halococcoides sp.]
MSVSVPGVQRVGRSTVGRIESADIDRAVLALPATILAALLFGSRLAINARVSMPIDPVGLQDSLVTITALACAGSILAIAVLHGRGVETVGLSVVGVFGVLGVIARPATAPAAVAIVAGSTLAIGAKLSGERALGATLVAGLLIGGLAGSLAGVVGFESATTRPIGSQIALLGAAGTPAVLARGRLDWTLGAIGAGLLVVVAAIAPFVLGATGLVAGAIVGASVPVMALALGGVTTTASAALRTEAYPAALGAGLLLFAGVPATIPRALAVVLAMVVLIGPRADGDPRA